MATIPDTPQQLQQLENANFRHLVADAGWYGFAVPAINSFFAVYAIKLGATPLQLGLLSSLPAIMMLISTMLTESWQHRFPDSRRAVFHPTLLMRFRVLLCALAPFLPPAWQVPFLIVVVASVAIPQGMSNVIFLVMMREAITDKRLTSVVSRRQLALNLCIAASTLACGFWLERTFFPANYQVMFLLAFLATLMSVWHVTRINVFNVTPEVKATREEPDSRPWFAPRFRNLILIIIGLFAGFYALAPVIPLWLVQGLGANEGFVAIYSFLELIGAATGSTLADRLIVRHGYRRVVLVAMSCTALAGLILALSPSLVFTLPAALLSGMTWVMVDISQFSFFSAHTPAHRRSSFTRAYFQGISIASFIGPLIGSTLADHGLSLPLVLIIGAGLRLAAGIVFFQRGRRTEDLPAPAPAPTPAR